MLAVPFSRQEPSRRSGTLSETETLYHFRREKAILRNGSRNPLLAGLEKKRAYGLEQVSCSGSRPTRLSVVAAATGFADWDSCLPITPQKQGGPLYENPTNPRRTPRGVRHCGLGLVDGRWDMAGQAHLEGSLRRLCPEGLNLACQGGLTRVKAAESTRTFARIGHSADQCGCPGGNGGWFDKRAQTWYGVTIWETAVPYQGPCLTRPLSSES